VVDAFAVGEFEDFLLPVGGLGVVDDVCSAEGFCKVEFLGGGGRGDDSGAEGG
jgi:hypothetical protein